MTGVEEFGFGLLLGFSLTIPPGPMNALIASLSVRSWRAGFVTGLGAMSADLVLGLLVYGLRSVVDLTEYLRVVYVLGAIVMGYFGYRLWVRRNLPAPPIEDPVRTFSQALGVGVSNPVQIAWWLTAGLAFAYLGGLILFVGLFSAILVWILVFPTVIHRGSRRYPAMRNAVAVVSCAILFGFAAYFVYLAR